MSPTTTKNGVLRDGVWVWKFPELKESLQTIFSKDQNIIQIVRCDAANPHWLYTQIYPQKTIIVGATSKLGTPGILLQKNSIRILGYNDGLLLKLLRLPQNGDVFFNLYLYLELYASNESQTYTANDLRKELVRLSSAINKSWKIAK